jgi:hypothetical protein
MEPGITVQPDEVRLLAAQLSALAAEMADDARTCRATAARLEAALGGNEGWRAAGVATAWGALASVVAARAGAVAATLVSASTGYLAADADLADGMPVRAHR